MGGRSRVYVASNQDVEPLGGRHSALTDIYGGAYKDFGQGNIISGKMGNRKCNKRTNKSSDPLNRSSANRTGQNAAYRRAKAAMTRSRKELALLMIGLRKKWDRKATQKSILKEIDASFIGRNAPNRSKGNSLEEQTTYWAQHVVNYRRMVNERDDMRGDMTDFSGNHPGQDQVGPSEGVQNVMHQFGASSSGTGAEQGHLPGGGDYEYLGEERGNSDSDESSGQGGVYISDNDHGNITDLSEWDGSSVENDPLGGGDSRDSQL